MVKLRKYRRRSAPTGEWEVDVRVELANGEVFRQRVVYRDSPSKVEARTWGEEREHHVKALSRQGLDLQGIRRALRGENANEAPRVPTFAEFQGRFLTYSEVNNKPSTVYAKRCVLESHLSPFFGAMKLDEIGPVQVEEFKAKKLAEGQSKKSVNNHLTALRKLLNLAVEWEVIARAPKVKGFRYKNDFITEDKFLSFDEAERFLRAAAPEWMAFLTTALKTGLRVGELLALKWEDVDLVGGQVIVRRTLWRNQEGPPKGGINRKVPLSDEALATLKGHRHLKGPYVFCQTNGRRLTHSRVKDVVPDTCERAGLGKRLTNHGLRHTFASHLVMRGAPLMAVKELLGHESIEMTLRYSHLSPDVKRDAVMLLDLPAAGRDGVPRGGGVEAGASQ
jgi:integrase